ncbi:MAG: intradiol ring-cleavage dioxygenase [Microthrixaceae bacterium]
MLRSRTTTPDHAHDDHGDDDHDRGLQFDLSTLVNRRRSLALLGGAGLVSLAACLPEGSSDSTTTTTSASGGATSTTTASGTSCSVIPEETAGPYPGDGSNGVNVLSQSGVVRSDIRSSFGSSTTTATGSPLEIVLKVLDTSNSCNPLVGAAVYLWHANIDGKYSMYSQGVTNENYLRGVQETDSNGEVHFTSIFPGCYDGRWPHLHFEVYPSVAKAVAAGHKLRTSQMAMPQDVCQQVYATSGYSQSITNLSRVSLKTDNVFSDGYSLQLGTMTGSVGDDLRATLAVPV